MPRILARPDLPTVNLPRVSAAAAGAPFEALSHAAGEWGAMLKKQKDAQDLLTLQNAVDTRDELYRKNALEQKLRPQDTGSITADQFITQFKAQAKMDDATVLKDLPANVRGHAEVHFARLQKTAFDSQFNDYRSMYIDQAKGTVITQRDDLINKIAQTDDPAQQAEYQGQLNGLLEGAKATGIFHSEQIANMKRDVNSDVEAAQANKLALNKSIGGPQQVLANFAVGQYPNIKPQVKNEIIANATRLAGQNEREAEKNHKAAQDGMFNVTRRLVTEGDPTVTPQMVRDMVVSNTIRGEQGQHLYSIMGNPTFVNPPGAVNGIMYQRATAGEPTFGSNNAARQQLLKLDGRQPEVKNALNLVNNSDAALRSKYNKSGEITQAVREFRGTQYSPNSNKTVMQHFAQEGVRQTQAPKYHNAENYIQMEMGKGRPKQQVMDEALKMVRPQSVPGAGKSSNQKVLDYGGE